jgi:predicted dehydrogenase
VRELRGALIGCGFFAANHLHAWRDVQGAEIVAICDANPARLNLLGDQFNIPSRYADAKEMLVQERPDFVDIATTVISHRPLVELAANLKIPVICQKPFALNLQDAEAMVEACAKANVPLMVHENFRWQSALMKVKTILEAGTIGKAFWGRVSFRSAYDVFSGQPYLAEGERFIVEDLGIHALDVARFLFGDVQSLIAHMARIKPNIKGEDVATIMMKHNDLTSVIDCSYASLLETENFPETLIEIDATEGSLRLSKNYKLSVTTSQGTKHYDVSPPVLPWAQRPWHNIQESVFNIQQHWVECLRSGVEPATSGNDNIKTFALVEAAYQSAASGKTVELQR